MKATVKLRMKDFRELNSFSADNYVICNKWGVCFETVFSTLRDANNYFDEKGLRLPEYFICRIDWYN